MKRAVASLLVASLLAFATPGSAQAPGSTSPQDVAAAEVLFQSAQELFATGDYRAACAKFAASYDLDPGLGTLLNLARCYERDGRSASAWAAYVDLAALATRARQADRARIAEERRAALEPELMHLRLVVPGEVEVLLDDEPVAAALFGSPLPVDPGEHRLAARRPGAEPYFEETLVVEEPGKTVELTVPPPPAEPPPVEPPPAPLPPPDPAPAAAPAPIAPPPPDDRTAWWIAGGITSGVGAVLLAVSAGFTADASSAWSDAGCDAGICPDVASQALSDQAGRSADVATGLAIAGGTVAAAGVVLLLVGALGGDDPAAIGMSSDGLTLRF